jgi:hypothetical protein
MKALTAAAVTLVLLGAPSSGIAQTKLPVGEADGVRIVRERGAIVFVFTQRASKLYRRIAGRLVRIDCTGPADEPLHAYTGGDRAITTGSGGGMEMRAPKRGRRLVTGDRTRGMDYCRVWLTARIVSRHGKRERIGARLIVSVPLTQTGAVFLDEQSKAFRLVRVLVAASLVAEQRHLTGWPTYALLRDWGFRKLGERFVKLASPTDTPPAGAIGYYSDGHEHVAIAILSGSGRRLFVEYAGDVVSTNVTSYIFIFRGPSNP